MVKDSAPHRIDPRGFYDCTNALLEEDGSVFKRGGTSNVSLAAFGSSGLRFLWDGYLDVGHRTVFANSSDFGVIDETITAPDPNLQMDAVDYATVAALPTSTFYPTEAPGNTQIVGETELTVDGVSPSLGDRILVKNETDAERNGVYEVVVASAPGFPFFVLQRVAEMNESSELITDMSFPVLGGSTLAGTSWKLTSTGPFTINTTDLAFAQVTDNHVNLGSDGLTLPKSAALLEGLLFIGGGYIYGGSKKTANYTTGTISLTNGSKTVTGSGTTWNTLTDAGMLLQRGDERVYVVESIDSTTQLTLRDAYEGVTGAGLAYTLSPFYKMTTADPYETSDYYAVCANRLVRLTNNKIQFSEVERPHKWTVTIGSSEIPNEHELPEGVRGTGLATVGQTLLVFTNAGVWVLNGLAFDIVDSTGNGQHTLSQMTRELSLWGMTGIASWQQAAIVPCVDGVHLLDGVSAPLRLSASIDQLIRLYADRGYRPGQATVYRSHYILPVLDSAARVKDTLVCRLDRAMEAGGQRVFPWTRLTGDGMASTALAIKVPTDTREPQLLGAQASDASRVLDLSDCFEPNSRTKNDADGSTPAFFLVTRDYETGGLTKNTVRAIRSRYEMIDAASDDPQIIFDYGTGARESGGYTWDDFDWADETATLDPEDLYWEDEDDDIYYALNCAGAESDGIDPHRCRVNKRLRYVRFRIRNHDPTQALRFRSLELVIRPSKASRH